MRKLIVLLTLCGVPLWGVAQETPTSGVVIYDMTRKFQLPKVKGSQLDSDIADMLPKERKSKKELIFSQDISIFRNSAIHNADEEAVREAVGGSSIVIRMSEPEEIIFFDIKSQRRTEQREFMGRKFLVEGSADTAKWKITGRRREVLGYSCLEAELVGAEQKTLAWFAPTLPIATGPHGLVGLPGLILAVDIGEGRQTIVASSIDFRPIGDRELVKPKEGKRVTAQEFKAIVEAKTKEMEAASGGSAVSITIER